MLFIVLFLAAFSRPVSAQTQFALWGGTFQNYKLSSRIGIAFDAQWRSVDQVRQMHALLLRPGLNLYFTPALTGTVGYAFVHQLRTSGAVTDYLPEHRIWEQLLFTHPLTIGSGSAVTAAHHNQHRAAATLTHRLRLEQRYLPRHHAEGNALVKDGHRHAGRLRYFARGILPLSRQSSASSLSSTSASDVSSSGVSKPVAFTRGWFAALQNEVFVNVGDASAVNGKFFDQNRAYIAAGYRWSKQFDTEVGYMNQYISGAGSASTNNHIVQVATYVRL